MSLSTAKSARPARPLFLAAEKGTKRLPANAHKIQFYAARFTTRFAQTNKTLLPRKTDFIDGRRPETQRQQHDPKSGPQGSLTKASSPNLAARRVRHRAHNTGPFRISKNPAKKRGFKSGILFHYSTCLSSTGKSRLSMRTALCVLVFWSSPKMFTR